MFLGLLLKNWQLVAIGVLVLALAAMGIYVKTLKGNIAQCEAEKDSLVVKLEVSNASIAALQTSINEQNAAVEKFKSAADERAKKNATDLAKARSEAANYKKKAGTIITRVAPSDVTTCDAANQLINEVIQD